MRLARSKRMLASLFASALLATGAMAPAAHAQQDGLVNVNVENVLNNNDIDVVVSVQAAAAIAANVCGVAVDANVLAAVDERNQQFGPVRCDAVSRAFQGGDLTITNN
jgi:ABC-type Zn uptake system ZnuABC Zn-binding protein ZnuA